MRATVVSDTGPLHYLALIGESEVLPRLFGAVVVPRIVAEELARPGAPLAVREWIAAPPTWLSIRPDPPGTDAAARPRGAGERAAVSLAVALGADLLLVDDRAGRATARARGLVFTGTVGLLDLAAEQRMVDLPAAVARLRATNFRHGPGMLDDLLERHRRGDEG